nr:MAG TPA: hypothetical protein [Caudoviricetes sp.]
MTPSFFPPSLKPPGGAGMRPPGRAPEEGEI